MKHFRLYYVENKVDIFSQDKFYDIDRLGRIPKPMQSSVVSLDIADKNKVVNSKQSFVWYKTAFGKA